METVCDRETAKREFDRWVEASRIDMDVDGLDVDDVSDSAANEHKIIKAIMDGRLVINEDGFAVFSPPGRDSITFDKNEADLLGAADRVKVLKGREFQAKKMYAMLAAWSGTSIATFSNGMHQADRKVCMALITLFLAQ
jgi:hypothetical protein